MQTIVKLTPSTNAVVTTYSTYINVSFQITTVQYWLAQLSTLYPTKSSTRDYGNSIATFVAGLQVTLKPVSNGTYSVTLNGKIVDLGSTYSHTNFPLGTHTMP